MAVKIIIFVTNACTMLPL